MQWYINIIVQWYININYGKWATRPDLHFIALMLLCLKISKNYAKGHYYCMQGWLGLQGRMVEIHNMKISKETMTKQW